MINAIDFSEVTHLGLDGLPDRTETWVKIPMRTVSESNKREHWAARAKRTKAARQLAAMGTTAVLTPFRKGLATMPERPVTVHLVRVAPRELDDDNLRAALKAVRDGVTDALGLSSDRDSRLRWEYSQRRGAVREHAVWVKVWRTAG